MTTQDGVLDPIETFLTVNALDIPDSDRAKIFEAAMVAVLGGEIRLNRCPEHLRAALTRLVIEAAYQIRNKGKSFRVFQNKLWV